MPLPRVDIPEILGEGCGDITALEQVLGRPGDRVVRDASPFWPARYPSCHRSGSQSAPIPYSSLGHVQALLARGLVQWPPRWHQK
jgi:hypothetical protein